MYSLTILCCESVMGAKWGLVPHKTNIVKGLRNFQLLSEIYICLMEGKKRKRIREMIRKKWPKERKGTENRMFGCISKKNNNNKGTDLKKRKEKEKERRGTENTIYVCGCM